MPPQKGNRAARSLGGALRTLFTRLCARAGEDAHAVEPRAKKAAKSVGPISSSAAHACVTDQDIKRPAPERAALPRTVASGFHSATSERIGRPEPLSAAEPGPSPADVTALMQEVAGFIAWEQAKGRCWIVRQLPGREFSQPVGQPPTNSEGQPLEGMRYKLALDKLRRQLILGGHRQALAALEDASDWGHPGRGIETPLDRLGPRAPYGLRHR